MLKFIIEMYNLFVCNTGQYNKENIVMSLSTAAKKGL